MSIHPLPPEAASRILASATITTLNEAVLGLAKNALDADASRVSVSLDYARGNCTVDDDGEGIPPAEFRAGGALGRLHHTSRWPPNESRHGAAGAFLASLAENALLTVSSRHREYHSHNALVMHHAKPVVRHAPAPPSLRFLAFEHGTRVAVRDLFGAMPVRVKQRGLMFGGGNSSAREREWDALVRALVALVLAWNAPGGVELRIRDEASRRTVRLRDSGAAPWDVRVSAVMAQAGLVDGADAWVKVKGSLGGMAVVGAISLVPAPSKRCQFLSLGIHPLTAEAGAGELFEEINSVFAGSDFGTSSSAGAQRTARDDGRARRGIDRWPMFFLRLSLTPGGRPRDDWYSLLDPVRLSEAARMTTLVRAVCYEVLKKHQFRPKGSGAHSRLKGRSGASRSASSSRPGTPRLFDSWSVRKVGAESGLSQGKDGKDRPSFSAAPARSKSTQGNGRGEAKPAGPLVGRDGKLLRPPFLGSDEPYDDDQPSQPSPAQTTPPSAPETPETPEAPPDSNWLQSLLARWQNPVFETAEPSVPCIGPDSVPIPAQSTTRISRSALARALVISQVDNKFILVKARLESGSSCLVLVDQHAADERVNLEALMADFFVSDKADAISEQMEAPLRFEVSPPEARRLDGLRSWFRHWGVGYDVDAHARACTVTSLPPAIHGRCLQEPRLLIDLIRRALWGYHPAHVLDHGHDHNHDHDHDHESATPAAVSRRFHGCPAGILELLSSRACRTAIMFNDVLSPDECGALIRRLAACALPFQCAHGRPVLVPMVQLGGLGGWQPGERAE